MTVAAGSRVLLLGATGTLGRAIAPVLGARYVVVTPTAAPLDALAPGGLTPWLAEVKVDAVVNCVAALDRKGRPVDAATSVGVNAWFPHRLAAAAATIGVRVVHISTDGVFSGRRGNYAESDIADPIDRYGREKLAGELDGPGCLTLRTTFFGASATGRGVVEWLLTRHAAATAAEPARVGGFARYSFSGLSTRALGEAIVDALALPATVHGVLHVGGPAVSKCALLEQLVAALRLHVVVDPLAEPEMDRSLDSRRFWTLVGRAAPTVEAMVEHVRLDVAAGLASMGGG